MVLMLHSLWLHNRLLDWLSVGLLWLPGDPIDSAAVQLVGAIARAAPAVAGVVVARLIGVIVSV